VLYSSQWYVFHMSNDLYNIDTMAFVPQIDMHCGCEMLLT